MKFVVAALYVLPHPPYFGIWYFQLLALRRAGRFDITIHVPPPDPEARTAILLLELSKRATSSRVLNKSWLANFARQELDGYTGAEVVAIVQAAAELARESHATEIACQHLISARHRVPPSTLEAYLKQVKQDHADQTTLEGLTKAVSVPASSPDGVSAAGATNPTWRQPLTFQLYLTVSAILIAVLAILMTTYIALEKE
uniref:AAA domain-containing protein n=1 Tax=Mesocestoides corti TaxID=53468 RepID=A0A5K3FK92_MESCO